MAGHHNKVLFAGASRKLIDLRNFCRQGFFHEYVFASLEDLLGEGEVTCGRRRDHYAINVGVFEDGLMLLDRLAKRKLDWTKRRRSALESTTYLTVHPGKA
jgi:hypothetical protein